MAKTLVKKNVSTATDPVQREEELSQVAEEMNVDVGSIPEKAMKPDREAQYLLEKTQEIGERIEAISERGFYLPNKRKGFTYAPVYAGRGGALVYEWMSQGWETVNEGDPEGDNIYPVGADGKKHVVDCIWMRIPTEVLKAQYAKSDKKAKERLEGNYEELVNIAEREGKGCFKVHGGLIDVSLEGIRGSRKGTGNILLPKDDMDKAVLATLGEMIKDPDSLETLKKMVNQ